jgi:hypothetical protein
MLGPSPSPLKRFNAHFGPDVDANFEPDLDSDVDTHARPDPDSDFGLAPARRSFLQSFCVCRD